MTPSGWRRVSLRNLVQEMDAGVSVNSEDRPITDGEVGILKTSCVTNGTFEPWQHKAVLQNEVTRVAVSPRADHIIMSRMNTAALVGANAYVKQDHPRLFLPDRLWQLSVSAGCDARWLAHVLGAAETRAALSAMATGTSGSMKNLTKDRVLGLPVLVPPLAEQRRIAAVLAAVDNTFEKTQHVLAQAKTVRQAVANELLTHGMPNARHEMVSSELGEVPVTWSVVRLGDVCERMFVGIAQAATHAYVESDGVPIVRTTNVRPYRINELLLRISHTFAHEMQSKSLRTGDVLSARTGYPGISAVVPHELSGAQCFTLLVSRPGPRLLAAFLCHLMNSALGARIVSKGQAGGAQQNLNVGTFCQALVALPSVEEQRAISAVIEAAFRVEAAEEQKLDGLRVVKGALSAALLSGAVRIRESAEAA